MLKVLVEVFDVQGLTYKAKQLPNPFIDVLVGGQSQWTVAKEQTSTCSFNRTFLFESIEANSNIDIRVFHKPKIYGKDLIGTYCTNVATISNLPNKRMLETLCPLTLKEKSYEPRGFVRLSINVLQPGDIIENVTQPVNHGVTRVADVTGIEFESGYLSINCHMAQGILSSSSATELPSPFVEVEYDQIVLTTQVQKATRHPSWNECLRFPACLPSFRDEIELRVKSKDDGVTLASLKLSFNAIFREEIRPSWYNLYSSHCCSTNAPQGNILTAALAGLFDSSSLAIGANSEGLVTTYMGRILLSAGVVKHKAPGTAMSISIRPMLPPSSQEVLCWIDIYELTGVGSLTNVTLSMSIGNEWNVTLSTNVIDQNTLQIVNGSIEPFTLSLPCNIATSPLFLLRVDGFDGSYKRTIAKYAVRVDRCLKITKPHWITLENVSRYFSRSSNQIKLLKSITCIRATDMKYYERPKRALYTMETRFVSVCVYQAWGLPVLTLSLPNPRVVMTIGVTSVSSQTIFHTTHPDWNEMLHLEAKVPSDPELSGDILLEVMSQEIQLGMLILPFSVAHQVKEPQWFQLKSNKFVDSAILIAIKVSDSPGVPNFELSHTPCDIRLLLIGARLFSTFENEGNSTPNNNNLHVQVEFGRSYTDCNKRLWYGMCKEKSAQPVDSASTSFVAANYFQSNEIRCFLPETEVFQSFIECRVFSPSGKELGSSYILLNNQKPWLSTETRRQCEQRFEWQLPEVIPPPIVTGPTREWISPFQPKTLSDDKWNSSFSRSAKNEFCSELYTCHGEGSQQQQQQQQPLETKFNLEGFTWTEFDLLTGNSTNDELDSSYETERCTLDDLQYRCAAILSPGRHRCSTNGSPDVIGMIKYRCQTLTRPEENLREDRITDGIICGYGALERNQFVVRIHVLAASGLVCHNPEEAGWLIEVKTSRKETTIVDSSYVMKGMAPEFYRSFEIPVEFPSDCILSIGILSVTQGMMMFQTSYELFGRTLIDLENRWFSSSNNGGHDSVTFPVETRTLRNSLNNLAVGRIRLKLEMLSKQASILSPMVPLSMPMPEHFEVRLVIWQLRGVKLESASYYVIGIMEEGGGDVAIQESDTHWNSRDGTGLFNWRMIFNVVCPSVSSSQLKIQTWAKNVITSHEALAELALDLSSDLEKCRTTQEVVELDKTWLKLSHPNRPNEWIGEIQIELSIYPKTLAAEFQVGHGRDEPNMNPFLPDVKRDYVSTSIIGRGFFAASEKLAFGAKVATWFASFIMLCTVVYILSRFFK